MGACQSKKSSASVSASASASQRNGRRTFEDELNDSLHGKHRTTRQKLARHYEDMHISEAYNVQSVLGQGSMGEVTLVEKKNVLRTSNHDTDDKLSVSVRHCNFSLFPNQSHSKGNRQYACKTVNTLRMNNSELREFLNETDILRDLDHPNIVQLFEVYRQKRKIWIVMELCLGGDLFSRADTNTEEDVVIILEQITRAVAYMHKRNVCHRDIKMENILYTDNSPTATIKLIDFGLSNNLATDNGHSVMPNVCGTLYAAAPELLLKMGCTEQTDIWSIGIVAFILLSTQYPFLKEPHEIQDETKLHKLENANYTFDDEWDNRNVTSIAREFISKCLQKNPFMRCSALDALDHVQSQWIPHLESLHPQNPTEDIATSCTNEKFDRHTMSDSTTSNADSETSNSDVPPPPPQNDTNTNHLYSKSPCSPRNSPLRQSTSSTKQRLSMSNDMLQGMSKFGKYGDLKKTILMTISYDMDKSSLQELSELFIILNTSQDGTITLLDLKHALKTMDTGKHLDNYGIEEIFKGVDVDTSGQIHYNEFLAAVVESQGLITTEHFAEAFNRIDNDGKGYISKHDLKQLLGKECDDMNVNKMLKEANLDSNGKIDYKQFLNLMES